MYEEKYGFAICRNRTGCYRHLHGNRVRNEGYDQLTLSPTGGGYQRRQSGRSASACTGASEVRRGQAGGSQSGCGGQGYGERYTLAGNDTAAGKQQNRRVEVIILNEGVKPESQFRK
jgi:hypothetical protein